MQQNEVVKRQTCLLLFGILLAAWVLLDLRMGSEYLSWIAHDRTTYIEAPPETRTFRDRKRFYDFASFASPLVSDRKSYIFFGERQWPYLGNMRYLTYPAIPGIDVTHDDTWVIYRRSDVTVSSARQLMIGGEAVTEAGTILGQFDDHSFVFRTDLPPSPSAS